MNLRKIIREELEKVINNDNLANKFDQDITYLKDFSLNKKENKRNSIIWVFDHNKHQDYIIRFYIQKNIEEKNWKAKIFIYWKEPSKEFTHTKGKDIDFSFGPYSSYKEMIDELNRKLKNNPLISPDNYLDNNKKQLDLEVIEMIKRMLKKSDKIEQVKDIHFKDLKKLLKKVKHLKTYEEIDKYTDDNAPETGDKQTLLLTIQKIDQLDFYLHKEKMESLF